MSEATESYERVFKCAHCLRSGDGIEHRSRNLCVKCYYKLYRAGELDLYPKVDFWLTYQSDLAFYFKTEVGFELLEGEALRYGYQIERI